MTENEAIKELTNKNTQIVIGNLVAIKLICKKFENAEETIDMAIKALEKVQKFESIGTIEEFKALKEEVELYRNLDKTNFSDGYAKAIDEFVKAEDYLMDKIKEETADVNIDFEWRKVVCLDDIRRMLHQGLCEIAEQLKAGGK